MVGCNETNFYSSFISGCAIDLTVTVLEPDLLLIGVYVLVSYLFLVLCGKLS